MHGNLPDRQKEKSLPTQMQELSEVEKTLIRSYRRWIAGMRMNDERYWSVVWTELSSFLDDQSARLILGGLLSLIAAIGNFSRRPVRLHPPCCGYVCEDELLILSLIGACQRRNHSLSRRRAEWLVSANGIAILLEGGQRIASALKMKEIELPNRTNQNGADTEIDSGALRLRVVAGELTKSGTF